MVASLTLPPRLGRVLSLLFTIPAVFSFPGLFADGVEGAIVELEPFEVTGTHLKAGSQSILSPIVIPSDAIEMSGAISFQDYFDTLPQAQVNLVDRDVFGFTPGATGINLRGAGVQYTLTLINGRRAASYGIGGQGVYGFVNIASIPMNAVERIEILPDSASAIYGSDAVAGVVNFVLKDNYEGLEVSASFANTSSGDQAIYEVGAIGGITEGDWSLTIGASFVSTEALYARDRSFSETGDQTARGGFDWIGIPRGSVAVIEDLSTGAFYIGSEGDYTTGELLTDRQIFDQSSYSFAALRDEFGPIVTEPADEVSLLPDTERTSLFADLEYSLSDTADFFFEFLGTQSRVTNTLHPAQIVSIEDLDYDVSQYSPYNPLGVNRTDGGVPTDVGIYYRNTLAGLREIEVDNRLLRFVTGLNGTLENDFEYEVAATYSEDEVDGDQGNSFLRTPTTDAFWTNSSNVMDPATALNVFGRFTGGPLGGDDYNEQVVPNLLFRPIEDASFKLMMLQGMVSGDLVEVGSHGPIRFAVGAEYRKEEWDYRVDQATEAEEVIQGAGVLSSSGERDVMSAFVELQVPLTAQLDAQLAARYEKFDGETSDNFSPKAALLYRLSDSVRLRGSYGQGFRAPSLPELFTGERTVFVSSVGPDPARGGEFVTNITSEEGGNVDLQPEESDTFMFGIVIEPTPRLRIGLDWSLINIENQIASDSLAEILELNDSRVIRADPSPTDIAQGYSGKVISIQNFSRNKAESELENLDLYLNYEYETDAFGRFDLSATISHMLSYESRLDSDSVREEFAGGYLYPEYKGILSLVWTKDQLSGFSSVNYIGSYDQLYGEFSGNEEVDPYVTVDVGFGFVVFETELTIEVINLFDEKPPFSDADSTGYDYIHSPVGRMFQIGAKKRF